MTGGLGKGYGSGGSYFDSDKLDYPGVPYSALDFNSCDRCSTSSCNIEDYSDSNQVRYCRLLGLKDLNQDKEYVRQKIADFLNHLTSIGVAGFRVDAGKHMLPENLANIYARLNNLNIQWFTSGAKPFIFHEVIDFGSDAIPTSQYTGIGRVTEFKYGIYLGRVFRHQDGLTFLENFGQPWSMMNDGDALVFIDNHDNQRGHGGGGDNVILTHTNSRLYKMATAFMLAWPYGVPRVMSSYAFHSDWQGPPSDKENNTLTVKINDDLTCADGWICEHRWRQIYNMARFGKYAGDAGVNDWWSGHTHQIAFSRGDRAFIAFNNEHFDLKATIQTGLAPGQYCDIISGNKENGKCTGKIITVNEDRKVDLVLSDWLEDSMVAIYVDSKIN
uniref:alpha-amylase n=1 Tax=Strigamia maritima TaxID=126957 RepID=T1J419_STRMM